MRLLATYLYDSTIVEIMYAAFILNTVFFIPIILQRKLYDSIVQSFLQNFIYKIEVN